MIEKLKEADDSEKWQCYRNLGKTEELKKNYKNAIKYFTQALEYTEESNKGFTLQKLGECQIKTDFFDNGIKNLTIAAKLQPFEEAKIYRKIGEFYEKKGNLSKTIDYFEKAMKINPKIGVKRKLSTYKEQLKME